ncbi:MAG: tetratricopeptide repeat protein, partial [Candidatus Omnitrophica bacterium]|nr:tetratricopeptide repeat protein [Candidatus Omnitrophota bacterium]
MPGSKNIISLPYKLSTAVKAMMVLCTACGVLCVLPAQAQQLSSKEAESLFVAQKAFEDGFYEVSLGLLERFLKNYPNSAKTPEVRLLIGQCYFYQNRFLDALGKFEELLNQPSAKSVKDAAVYWIAEVHFKGHNYAKAASYYQTIIAEFTNSAYLVHAYFSLGWCFLEEAKFTQALENFRIVEERFSKEPQARDSALKILECLYRMKDYAGARDQAVKYLKVHDKDASLAPYLHFYKAEADYYLDNFSDAAAGYAHVLTLSGDRKLDIPARLGNAWSFLKLKKYKEAQDLLAAFDPEALEQKDRQSFLLARAILAFETKKFSEAKSLYEQVIAANPETEVLLEAYLGKADSLYNAAEYKEAIAVYREALEKTPVEKVSQELQDRVHYGL